MPDKAITKEQWQGIKEALQSSFCHVRFRYQNTEISVVRVWKSESRTALCVYFDNKLCLGWGHSGCDNYNPITEFFWFTRTRRCHSAKEVQKLEKALGKRYARKHLPSLYESYSYRVPEFASSATLIRQFRKAEGLVLITEKSSVPHG